MMYLLFPQLLSNGPAKSRFNSSLGSNKAGSSLFCVVGMMLFLFLPVWVHCAINPVEVNLPVYMWPPNILCQVFHTELARVRFM